MSKTLILPVLGVIIVGLFIFFLLRPIIQLIIEFVSKKLHTNREIVIAAKERNKNTAQGVRVRQTDIFNRLDIEGKKKYQFAEHLLAQGRIIDACRVFEDIKFQRRAIDELEKAKLFDEAAGVLFRLGAVHRIGVLYERNGDPLKAAQWYDKSKMYKKAGENFLKLTSDDYNYYEKAGDAFEKGESYKEAISAYSKVTNTNRIREICIENHLFDELLDYMCHPSLAYEVLAKMSRGQLQNLIQDSEIYPFRIHTYANWCNYFDNSMLIKSVLKKIVSHGTLLLQFWSECRQAVRLNIMRELVDIDETILKKLLNAAKHHNSLEEMAAMSALLNDIDASINSLKGMSDYSYLAEIITKLYGRRQAVISSENLAGICKDLESDKNQAVEVMTALYNLRQQKLALLKAPAADVVIVQSEKKSA